MNATFLQRRVLVRSVLLTLAILAFLGHIGSPASHVPIHVAADTHDSPGHDAEGSHVASCDATVSRAAPAVGSAPVAFVSPPSSPVVVAVATRVMALGDGARDTAGSPPLFLLHASLLI